MKKKDCLPQVICKPHWHCQNFSPLANGLYLKATTNKTPIAYSQVPNKRVYLLNYLMFSS